MTTIKIYKSYSFRDKDPVIDQLRTMAKNTRYIDISLKSGVSTTTLYNWFGGTTRRPQSATVEAVGRALGFKRDWIPLRRN